MVDREHMAYLPSPGYVTRQASSYDRGATGADQENWYANWDRTMFIREETVQGRTEHVMMDIDGPGAIVRIWMTFAGEDSGKGILRFYFDGEEQPSIEAPALDVISGGLLAGEPLSSSVSNMSPYNRRGHNLYLPLPYQVNCKITYESSNITNPGNQGNTGESVYYNINYRTYDPGTPVETFSMETLERAGGTLASIQELLETRDRGFDPGDLHREEISGTLAPGEAWITEFTGSKAIRSISLELDAEKLPQALRTTIIEAEFDGERTIWCPAGDFFGTGYQLRHSNTWYSRVDENGSMQAFWIMPFEKECSISILNSGDQEIRIGGDILTGDWHWDERSMHFGASWHQFTGIFTREGMTKTDPGSPFDVTYTTLEGEGVYVGDVLTLFNTTYMWWGEGDEKIYVDGEAFPSHFGTGTEDYYGYAWGGRSKRFSHHPFIAQPDESGNASPGYVVNLRYRGLDAIPFQTQLKVDMELWHWHSTYMNYAPACFYYLRPGGSSGIVPDIEGARARVAMKSTDIISNLLTSERMEAEHMSFHNSCGNARGSMAINPYGDVELSNLMHVYWRDGSPGDKITFIFVSETEGLKKITSRFSNGPGFGIFSASLNGASLTGRIDLKSPTSNGKTISLGQGRLRKGENMLVFEVMDNERETNVFALDYLLFK